MSERPELAVYVARVATGWSHVEKFYGYLVVQLLGAHAHTGMKMYKALSGSASQTAVLRAVARDRLSQPMMDELEELLRRTKKAAGKRNDVVHGLWEVSDELPKALVWCDSADSLLSHSEFWAGWLSHDTGDRIRWATKEFRGKGPRYLIYEEKDFQEILDEIQSVLARLMPFLQSCMNLNEPPSDEASLAGT